MLINIDIIEITMAVKIYIIINTGVLSIGKFVKIENISISNRHIIWFIVIPISDIKPNATKIAIFPFSPPNFNWRGNVMDKKITILAQIVNDIPIISIDKFIPLIRLKVITTKTDKINEQVPSINPKRYFSIT